MKVLNMLLIPLIISNKSIKHGHEMLTCWYLIYLSMKSVVGGRAAAFSFCGQGQQIRQDWIKNFLIIQFISDNNLTFKFNSNTTLRIESCIMVPL